MGRIDVSFDSWGEACAAWLYRPDSRGPDPAPCVVMAHGFAGIREAALDRFAERFAAAGLAALVFDYRHFGASGGTPRQLLDIRRQLADWAAAISYSRSLDDIDPERIALWGSSFSGGHVLATAARDSRLAAVVAQVPFVDGLPTLAAAGLRASLRLTGAGLRDQLGALAGRPPHMLKVVGSPGSLAAMTSPDAEPGYRALIPPEVEWVDEVAARIALRIVGYRPGRRVRRIECPVLFCIADHDAVTPPGPAHKVAGRTRQAEISTYAGGHFDVYVGDAFDRISADETEFLTRHLLGRPAAREAAAASAAVS